MKSSRNFFFVLFVMVSAAIHAQKVGIRAGATISNVSGVSDTKPLTGIYLGVFKEITIVPEIFFLQPELQYSMQGYKSGDTKVSIGYLNIPILAKVYAIKTFSLEAGPQLGFKINDNLDSNSGTKIKTFDTAFVGGLGYNFPMGLSINARYAMGISEIVKDSNAKNQVIQLGAAFKF